MRFYFKTLCGVVYFLLLNQISNSQNVFVSSIINDIKIDSLVNFVENISGEKGVVVNGNLDTIYSRHKTKPGNELAFQYILSEFERYGLQTDSLIFSATGKNALAIQPGAVYPNQYYIICAHYDDMPNLPVAPAADDDGSGVGAVLEAARVLSDYQFEYTIIYAIWDEEEQGLVGSSAYASLANTNNDSLLGVLNLDAIAWDSDNDEVAMIHSKPIGTSIALSDTIESVNTTYGINLDLAITNPGATYSDHASFWNNGFGAVLIIEDWTFDPNPHYHTDTDLIVYFNLPYYEKMAKLSIGSIATLAVPVGSLALHETISNHDLKIFPNPVDDVLNIQLNEEIISFALFDAMGKLVSSSNVNQYWHIIPMKDFQEGIYFLQINTKEKTYSKKIVRK